MFPDYELSDHRGMRRTISALQGGDPLVLVLSRGGFCPKERRQHEGLLQLHREMQVGYCRLVTISTDNLLETNEFRTAVGGGWTFLSDPGRKVQQDLDIAEYTDPEHNPMIPHTLVLEPGRRVYKIYNGYWFFGRPTVEELRHDLRDVTTPLPSGLGRQRRRAASSLGERRKGQLLPIREDTGASVRRTGVNQRVGSRRDGRFPPQRHCCGSGERDSGSRAGPAAPRLAEQLGECACQSSGIKRRLVLTWFRAR